MLSFIKLFRLFKPVWYYNLISSKDNIFFIDYNKLNKEDSFFIDIYSNYEDKSFYLVDAAYQAFHKGIIANNTTKLELSEDFKICLNDQYKFLRRFSTTRWVIYIFLIRIFLFNNPIKEILAFYKTRKVKMLNLYNKRCLYKDYKSYKSKLVESNPLVSIVIPTLNRYSYLELALKDLERQSYNNFEVIIIDQSVPFRPKFYNQFDLNINLIRQNQKLLWKARNSAIKESKGKYIAFFEDDVRVDSNWLFNHLKSLDYMNADISCGIILKDNSTIPDSHRHFRLAEQFPSGNAMVRKKVFYEIGLFDRSFEKMRMGDGEFGARCIKNKLLLISNPYSFCFDIKANKGGLREIGSWDGLRPTSYFSPRPVPSILYFFRKYWGFKNTIYNLIQIIPISLNPYRYKQKKIGYLISIMFLFLLFPFVMIQIIRAWLISSKMLFEGPQIDRL